MRRTYLIALAVAAGILAAGCTAPAGTGKAPAGSSSASGTSAVETTSTCSTVLMLGRSVTAGWMGSWGSDGSTPVNRNGLLITYHALPSPPEIADDAVAQIEQAPIGSTVFFKLCFVDFNGGDAADVKAELARNEGYVRRVVDAARKRGVVLVLGNALPKTRGETTRELVAEHKAYNAWLNTLVPGDGTYPVGVLDMYGVLAGPDGAIRPEYATGPDDAHPGDFGYAMLDKAFFAKVGGS